MATASNPRRSFGWDNPRQASWLQFAMWVLVGPVMISGLLAAFTPLVLVTAPLSALLVVAMGSSGALNASAFGALSGVGAGLLLIAYWNPWPWLLVALCFTTGGVAGYLGASFVTSRPAQLRQPSMLVGAWRVVGRAARYGATSAVLGVMTLEIFENHVRLSDLAVVAPIWAAIGALVGPRVVYGKKPKRADSPRHD